ncbi:MAG: site-specific integrase [Candidatus Bathyarchaeia archaeon]
MQPKYTHLLDDEDVRRWHENLAAKSLVTAGVYLRGLGLYCEKNDTTPREILEKARRDGKAFRDGFSDFVRALEREGKAGSYIVRFKKVLRSWLAYNGVQEKLKVNIRGEGETPTIAEERVPSHEEMAKILRKASSRARVSVSLMAFGGLRPESLGNFNGTDGLRLKDLPELELKPGSVGFLKMPTMLVIRRSLSKAGHQYFVFLPREATVYIREHLEERLRRGERLTGESPLLGLDPRGVRRNSFMRSSLVSRDIREAIRGAGFTWRPYILRAYCATAFDIAEAKGLISHPWRQFFMGHKGDIEARYSTNKGRLPPEMVEEMRAAYARCEPLLSTMAQPLEQSTVVKEAKLEALKSIAKSLLGIDLVEVKVARERERGRELTADEAIELFEAEIKKRREGGEDPQIIVGEPELEGYLKQGWQFVTVLPSQRILIRKELSGDRYLVQRA